MINIYHVIAVDSKVLLVVFISFSCIFILEYEDFMV